MLGEAAACLALDIGKGKLGGGFWTPATAMGEALATRLTGFAGVTFAVVE
jgi:saccharopine dehydrogenase (NAD+, L-glutamate forming)